jgi:hypothetical protein
MAFIADSAFPSGLIGPVLPLFRFMSIVFTFQHKSPAVVVLVAYIQLPPAGRTE